MLCSAYARAGLHPLQLAQGPLSSTIYSQGKNDYSGHFRRIQLSIPVHGFDDLKERLSDSSVPRHRRKSIGHGHRRSANSIIRRRLPVPKAVVPSITRPRLQNQGRFPFPSRHAAALHPASESSNETQSSRSSPDGKTHYI